MTGWPSRKIWAPVLLMVAAAAFPGMAQADIGNSLKSVLGKASDGALDKLAQPGAFYADTAIRIALPGAKGKTASKIMSMGNKAGVTTKLTKSLNDAAGLAAKEAKPIFNTAIRNISLSDVPTLVGQSDGATQYLQQSANDDLIAKIRPLIANALGKTGAFKQLGKLGKANRLLGMAGLDQEGLTDSVTKQTLNGIFQYMGKEEAALRKNPLGIAKDLLGVLNK